MVDLRGDLGSGKTTFVKGMIRGLGVEGPVPSPTYTLGTCYLTPEGLRVEHFDAYFGAKERAYWMEGAAEAFGGDCVCIVEWPEKVEDLLPEDRVSIEFEYGATEDERILTFHGLGPRSRERVRSFQDCASNLGSMAGFALLREAVKT